MVEPDKKKRKRVYFKLCPSNFSYTGNNHLKESHIEEYRTCKEDSSACPQSSSMKDKQQIMIGDSIKASQLLPRSSPRWKRLPSRFAIL